jgi:hypothetical protein
MHEYPPTSDSSDVPAPPAGLRHGDESSQVCLPSVFDRGPGFEALTASAERGAALGYPFLSVVNDVAGMALSPVSIMVDWSHSAGRAKVSVQFADPDDVDTVAEFYEITDDTSSATIYEVQGLVDERHHGGPGSFDLAVFSGRRPGAQ